jgi:hypothetical protein
MGAQDGKLPKVIAARRLIRTPKVLLEEVENRHVAIIVAGFSEHTFEGETEPTPTADIGVVLVEGGEAKPVAALTISWKRVVAALRLGPPGVWQVGRLVKEPEYGAVELHPPDAAFALEKVAEALAQVDTPTGQLELPAGDQDTPAPAGGGDLDDDIPFR